MAWLAGVPHEPLPYTGDRLDPVACVMHRTIGKWGGDRAVLSRGRVPSVHFLVGQRRDEWRQFYSTDTTCAHAAGANSWAVGIEFSGQNSDTEELTDWQIECGAVIVRELNRTHQIPLVFLENGPRVTEFRGFLNHSNIETTPQYKHFDFITKDAWDRMIGAAKQADPQPVPEYHGGQEMFLAKEGAGAAWIVAPSGVVPIRDELYMDLAGSHMPHTEKATSKDVEQWKKAFGDPAV